MNHKIIFTIALFLCRKYYTRKIKTLAKNTLKGLISWICYGWAYIYRQLLNHVVGYKGQTVINRNMMMICFNFFSCFFFAGFAQFSVLVDYVWMDKGKTFYCLKYFTQKIWANNGMFFLLLWQSCTLLSVGWMGNVFRGRDATSSLLEAWKADIVNIGGQ